MKKKQAVQLTSSDLSNFSEELASAMQDFVMYRDEIKYPMTPIALRRFVSQIQKLKDSKRSDEEIVKEIDRSIGNVWKAIYLEPLSENEQKVRYYSNPSKYKSLYTNEELEKLLS